MTESNSFDRQDKGADHYSDMIRNPARSVKVYNKLMWNERRQQINLDELDRIRTRNLNETRKIEKVYTEKLAELNGIKKYATNRSLLSLAFRNKRVISAKCGDSDSNGDFKPVTIYEMHLVDSKKLFTKAKQFLKQLSNPNDSYDDDDNDETNNEFISNNNVGIKSFENFNKIDTTKSKYTQIIAKTPSTTPVFATEIQDDTVTKVEIANQKFNAINPVVLKNKKVNASKKKVQIQAVKKNMIGDDYI
jgi:hypothetical protein